MKIGAIGCLLAVCGVLTAACSSPTNADATTSDVDAALGVQRWSSSQTADKSTTVVEGADADGNVRVRFTRTLATDASGAMHGSVTANIDGSPALEFTVTPDGNGTVQRNDFPSSPIAVAAAKAARVALQSSGGEVETSDVSLVTGAQQTLLKCIVPVAAAACVLAGICGLGGDSGAELTTTVVDAFVKSQCE